MNVLDEYRIVTMPQGSERLCSSGRDPCVLCIGNKSLYSADHVCCRRLHSEVGESAQRANRKLWIVERSPQSREGRKALQLGEAAQGNAARS